MRPAHRRWRRTVRASVVLAVAALGLLTVWPHSAEAPESSALPDLDAAPESALSAAGALPVAEELSFGVPVRLQIPHIGVDAPVIEVGRRPDGHMEAPEEPEATGWYAPGSRPGEWGSAVIAGHSGYSAQTAVFDDLGLLRPGDTFEVTDEAGDTLTFRVRESRRYQPYDRVPEVFSASDGRYLNLVSCTGTWDDVTRTHSERLVVFAEVVDPVHVD